MNVTFTKIHEKGYSVSAEEPGIDPLKMHPAPGYDARLPHDVAHFIVENELGILGGVFGQLAAGGTANTFFSQEAENPRKARKRGAEIAKANKKDALFPNTPFMPRNHAGKSRTSSLIRKFPMLTSSGSSQNSKPLPTNGQSYPSAAR